MRSFLVAAFALLFATGSSVSRPSTPSPAAVFTPTSNAPAINVVTVGAACNGVTNDAAAFQTALTTANTGGVGLVYVPPGTCKINTALTFPSNVRLYGAGIGKSKLLFANTTGRAIQMTSVSNAAISDLTMYTANTVSATLGGIEVLGASTDVTVERVEMYYFYQTGFHNSGGTASSRVLVRDNYIHDIYQAEDSVGVGPGECIDCRITNNQFKSIGLPDAWPSSQSHAIYAQVQTTGLLISQNAIDTVTDCMTLYTSGGAPHLNPIVADNTCLNYGNDLLQVFDSNGALVIGNTGRPGTANGDGFLVGGGSVNTTIVNNVIDRSTSTNGAGGVILTGGSSISVIGNLLRENVSSVAGDITGINIGGVADVRIRGNTIIDALYGITASTAARTTIIGNSFAGTRSSAIGIYASNTSDTVIRDNIMSGSGLWLLDVTTTRGLVEHNTAVSSVTLGRVVGATDTLADGNTGGAFTTFTGTNVIQRKTRAATDTLTLTGLPDTFLTTQMLAGIGNLLVPVNVGGTGASTASGARTSLSAASSGANSDITSLSSLSTPLSVAQGGTAATSASAARTSLSAAASGANSDITSLSSLSTPLSVLQGGTGSTTASGARTNLVAAASGANSDITSLSNLSTPLSVAQGGTAATTAAGARSSISAAALGANSDITSLSALSTPLSIGQGGTGSATQNFVDLTTNQSVAGVKTLASLLTQLNGTLSSGVTGQGSAVALTGNYNNVTASVANGSFVLPTPVLGQTFTARNVGTTNAADIYPASGHSIAGLGANNPLTLVAGLTEGWRVTFTATSATTWDAAFNCTVATGSIVKCRGAGLYTGNFQTNGTGTIDGAATVGGTLGVSGTATMSGVLVASGLTRILAGIDYTSTSTATDYTITTSNYYIGVTSFAATRTMTLPAVATVNDGRTYIIKDEAGTASITNQLVVDGNGAETVDGAANASCISNYCSITVIKRNGQWFVI